MAEDSNEQVNKKRKTAPSPTGSTDLIFNVVLGKLRQLEKVDERAGTVLCDYFKEHGSDLLEHKDSARDTLSSLEWPDEVNTLEQQYCLERLQKFMKEAKETTNQQRYDAIRETLCSSPVTNTSWEVEQKLNLYSVEARSWKVGDDVKIKSLERTTKALAEWDGSDKKLQYIAFIGSSGSGKTTAMLYSAVHECKFTGQSPESAKSSNSSKLTVYLESGAKAVPGFAGSVQDTTPAQDLLECGQKANGSPSIESMFYGVFKHLLCKANPYGLDILDDFWETTQLVLALDEVPNHWTHDDFVQLHTQLRKTFVAGVVLMVASTALSGSVLKQPTLPTNMVKVRMLPVEASTAMTLFDSRLERNGSSYSKEWKKAFSLLPVLLTNQRCAEITAIKIVAIIEALALQTPEDKALEYFASMSSFVMLSVAQDYLNMNGIMRLDYEQRIRLMAASLGLVSMQRVVQQGGAGGEVERHTKDSAHNSNDSKELVIIYSKGLVDREMVGDGNNANKTCFLEWSMSPALTLVCAVTLAPWFAEINHEPDKLAVLSCIQWLAIRFIQTQTVWKLQRLQRAVPRTGNDLVNYHVKGITESSIFLNGPLAAFGDVMVKTAQDSKLPQEGKTTPATPQKDGSAKTPQSTSSEKEKAMRMAGVVSPRHTTSQDTLRCAKIVQAKHTFLTECTCNVVAEMAKAGVLEPTAETKRGGESLEKLRTSYDSGRCLTGSGSQFEGATMVFLTNAVFTEKDRIEMLEKGCTVVQGAKPLEFGAPAWQSFYPFFQLCLPIESIHQS
jgi:hypothetical protein